MWESGPLPTRCCGVFICEIQWHPKFWQWGWGRGVICDLILCSSFRWTVLLHDPTPSVYQVITGKSSLMASYKCLKLFCTYEGFGTTSRYLEHGNVITYHGILGDVNTCPSSKYQWESVLVHIPLYIQASVGQIFLLCVYSYCALPSRFRGWTINDSGFHLW